MISIIIPTFNSEKHIADTIASCLRQEYQDIEILVCDDGSNDNTISILKDFKSRNSNKIKLFLLPHYGSPAEPRNEGLRNSQGDYIAFLDSDDIVHKKKFTKQIEFLERNIDIDLLCTNALKIDSKKNILGSYFKDIPKNINLKNMLKNNYVITSTVLIRKKILNEIGFFKYLNKNYEFYEDYEYWLRVLAKNKKIFFLNENLLFYRVDSGGLSNSIKNISISELNKKYLKTLQVLLKNELGLNIKVYVLFFLILNKIKYILINLLKLLIKLVKNEKT